MQGMCGGTHTYTDPTGKEGITGHDRTVHINHEGRDNDYTIHARPKHEDPLLRFFDMCPAYDDYVAKINADFLVSTSQVVGSRAQKSMCHSIIHAYIQSACLAGSGDLARYVQER